MADNEFDRRLTILENDSRQLASAINELIVETKLVAQATVSMQKTLSQLGDVYDKFILLEHKYDNAIRDLDFKYSSKVMELSEEISKNKDLREGFNRIKWAAILAAIGFGVTALAKVGGGLG